MSPNICGAADYDTPPANVYAIYLERLNLSAKVAYFIEYLRDYLSHHADKPVELVALTSAR